MTNDWTLREDLKGASARRLKAGAEAGVKNDILSIAIAIE